MIMEYKDGMRLYRLLDDVIQYAGEKMGWGELLSGTWNDSSGDNYAMTAYELINGERREEIIDAYVRDRVGVRSRRDLRQVENWKHGLAAEYILVREGADTFMYFDGHVFAVRGIMQEVDSMVAGLPAKVSCALIPFEGIITYCLGCFDLYSSDMEELDEGARLIREAIDARKVIRSSTMFLKTTPKIHAAWADHVDRDGKKGRTGSRPLVLRL